MKDARELSQTLAGEMIKKGMGIATNQKGITFGEYMLSDKYLRWSRTNRPAHQSIMENLKNVIPTWVHRKQLKLFTNEDFEKFVDAKDCLESMCFFGYFGSSASSWRRALSKRLLC